jgi:hypothetical protein
MFLNNDDFYQLRRITLSDLLDSESGYRLTSKCIVEAKKELLKFLNPDFHIKRVSKKRKREQAFGDDNLIVTDQIVEYFEYENELTQYYSQGDDRKIILEEIPEL